MYKKLFILISLIVAIFILWEIFQLLVPRLDAGKEYTVELRDDGFYPRELAIQKGDVVNFTSRTRTSWPASDIHPSHTIYSEFDPQNPIGAEEGWGFRFTKVGEWKYHDHLAPYFTGKIIVTDGRGKASGSLPNGDCQRLHSNEYCWQEELLSVLEKEDLDATFDRLALIYDRDDTFRNSCHYLTHNIGIAAYTHYLADKDSVLTPRASVCGNGFYHGFMEAFFSANLDTDEAREFCRYVDEKLTPQAPDARLQCYHGIGHGAMDIAIMAGSKGESEQSLIGPALEICRSASDTEAQLYRCASGIFNGIANFYIEGDFGLSINKDDPLWLCHDQPEEFKLSCYGNMNSAIYWYSDNDFSRAMSYVENIKEETQAVSAMRYLAALASIYEGKNTPAILADCRSLPENLQPSCIEGFAHGFLEHGAPGEEYKEAIRFCSSELLTQGEKDICFTYALNLGGWYPKEKVREICAGVEEQYKKFCRY